ncbi:MAG: PEPxxWA-CTERM sorting domain-containing protein, partial [Sphingomicrobium sp.]
LAVQSFALTGSGTSSVTSPGTFDFAASGSGSFALDPSFFLYDSGFPFDFMIAASDPGLFNSPSDTNFTSTATVATRSGACFGGDVTGGDQCNSVRYTLTYIFSPVPEPGTWAMMLIGFLAVGGALRRRTAVLPALA